MYKRHQRSMDINERARNNGGTQCTERRDRSQTSIPPDLEHRGRHARGLASGRTGRPANSTVHLSIPASSPASLNCGLINWFHSRNVQPESMINGIRSAIIVSLVPSLRCHRTATLFRNAAARMSSTRTPTALSRWSCQQKNLPPVNQIKDIHVYDFDNTRMCIGRFLACPDDVLC